ncbi:MAG: hypothetical protein ACRC8T_05795 [Acidaminococcaceae bacterium]
MLISEEYKKLEKLSMFIEDNNSYEELSRIIELAEAIIKKDLPPGIVPPEIIEAMAIKAGAKNRLKELLKR